ncbi:flagellar hook-associated protein FlgK [Oceanisphaera profunda]|uniref:Flagellar hook-associated protein 1 n=1 Tax=Oceanisphaera profunda TaxID=1416627 RepID=A0A1Y0D757_9GAMM|nr:flagellar hook-associated protein FlgK [Oceanisphaera profunda]ART83360.1 flagellar hook-associated protein FlgK [Oceanisphaera profunda]
MAVDMYQTGVSGLMAAQKQLATTGHNIANVNTEGFNRQRAEQMTEGGLNSGGQFYGTGTRISDVTRMYQQYAFKDVLINSTEQAGATTMYQQLNYLNSSVNDNGKALSSSLDSLYKTIDAFTDNPRDLGNRQLLLAHAQEVAGSFNTLHSNLNQQYSTSSEDIASRANRVSELAAGIAELNQEIMNVGSSGSPNDLLDRRDKLISDLGQEVSITTISEPNGVVSVMLGGRDTLVSGSRAFSLEARLGNPDPQQTELYLTAPDQAKQATKLTASDLGGKLGATAKFRDTVLAPTLSDIGRTAIGLADAFNQVQRQGLDLTGVPGADLFTDINSDSARIGRFFTDNSNVSGEVTITDTSKLTGSEYRLDYKDDKYFITDLAGGEPQEIMPDDDGKLNVDGFSVSISGTPVNGDSMLIRPTRNGAADIGVSLKKPEGLAAASQFTTTANDQNSGNASVSAQITNHAGTNLPTKNDPLVVSFNAAGEYQVVKKSDPTIIIQDGTLDPQDPVITLDGLTINVSGQAGTADSFEVATASGAGNNVNAQAFGDIKQQKMFNGGKNTIGDSINQTLVGIGGKTHSQKIKADSATAALAQSHNRMQSVSGVNLDEEAANLLRFQQAYMASSRVITVANEMFNSLLQIR